MKQIIKEDEELPISTIQNALHKGELSLDEIVEEFRHEMAIQLSSQS